MGCGCGKKKVESVKLPPLSERAVNFSKALYKHIVTGSHVLQGYAYISRLKICRECEHYNALQRACSICGCYVKTKCRWADQECPLDPPKWKEVKD